MTYDFSKILPQHNILTQEFDKQPFLVEWRGRFSQDCVAVLLPETTQQVAECVTFAKENNLYIVPQSGNTGLVGGQMPKGSEAQVIISSKKLNKIRDISPYDYGITAEAGTTLATIQQTAFQNGFLFPLSLASEGSATIGGLISTNAGGTNVIKYGNMRELVFGLEVVLPNGDIINDTHYLRKNNTGFDIKHLFIGAEGFHGFVTAASLKLFPQPKSEITVLLGVASPSQALIILNELRQATGDNISEFELMPQIGVEFVLKHHTIHYPFSNFYPWYCLITATSGFSFDFLRGIFLEALEKIYTQGHVLDVIVAENISQSQNLRQIRLLMSESQKPEGASIKHDVSVPVRYIPNLIERGVEIARKLIPNIRPCPFGHMGDGNIHFNFSQPIGMDKEKFMGFEKQLNHEIFTIVYSLNGCFSAEHGIGSLRIDEMHRYRSGAEISLRKNLKQAIDPNHLFNINKIL